MINYSITAAQRTTNPSSGNLVPACPRPQLPLPHLQQFNLPGPELKWPCLSVPADVTQHDVSQAPNESSLSLQAAQHSVVWLYHVFNGSSTGRGSGCCHIWAAVSRATTSKPGQVSLPRRFGSSVVASWVTPGCCRKRPAVFGKGRLVGQGLVPTLSGARHFPAIPFVVLSTLPTPLWTTFTSFLRNVYLGSLSFLFFFTALRLDPGCLHCFNISFRSFLFCVRVS